MAFIFLIVGVLPMASHTQARESSIQVHWELISNFAQNGEAFEARFTIKNNSHQNLDDANWSLFFNMSPRPLLTLEIEQDAQVEHINGDWYRLVPNKGFHLDPGESVTISYWGTEGVIKESDAPMGLYFVFYDENRAEKEIVQVDDYSVLPFDKEEQLLRGKEDKEAPSSPMKRYQDNLSWNLVDQDKLLKIIPSPVSIDFKEGKFLIKDDVEIFYEGSLTNEASYVKEKFLAITGIDLKIGKGKAPDKGIFLKIGVEHVQEVDKEAYNLEIDDRGIHIIGSDAAGVFYGIQSLLALLPPMVYLKDLSPVEFDYVRIEDAPRFPFRSLHLDVARNFQTKATVLKTLDLLAHYKVNHFLLYLTEDEGWRLEIDGLPELTEVGAQRAHTTGMETAMLHPAYGSGPVAYDQGKFGSGYYTKADFVEILEYAKARHITVIPEINFPGHARAAIKAMEARYNRLMGEGKEEAANEYRLIEPEDFSVYLSAQSFKDNVVSVARESTYRFYEKVVDEMAKLYQEAGLTMEIIHAGGDEVPEGSWSGSPMAIELMKQLPEVNDPKNLQAYFFRRLLKSLEERNLEVHVWEEMALIKNEQGEYKPNPEFVGRKVVPYIWNNMFDYPDLGYQMANMGYEVVLCNVSNFYFDLAYDNDPKEPGLYWAGFVNTKDAWTFAPFDWFKTTYQTSMGEKVDLEKEYKDMERLKPEARKNIKGLEAQLWSETIKGREMLFYYMLPKLLGFAESAWATERSWETLGDHTKREEEIERNWNIFSNSVSQREFPKLSDLNEGYNYRIPPPGAVIDHGRLMANVAFPGLEIRYTLDNSTPDQLSLLYKGPITISGTVKLRSFDLAGNFSRTVTLKPNNK